MKANGGRIRANKGGANEKGREPMRKGQQKRTSTNEGGRGSTREDMGRKREDED